MKPLKASTEQESTEGGVTVWRPWQLKSLELFRGVAVSASSLQQLTQEYLLISVQSGTAHLQYRNTRFSGQVVDGMLLVIEPGETWTCQPKSMTFHRIGIDPVWLQRLAVEMIHREKPLSHFPGQIFFDSSLSRTLCDLAAKSLSPASYLQQEETLLYLFASLLLSHAEDAGSLPRLGWERPAIKRTMEYLQAHYAQEVTLQELASVANLSPFHFARLFCQAVGQPPHAYQTKLRLAQAKTLLAQGYNVGYVAHETGFFDQSHFAQQFKRYFLVTPGSYCKTARFS